MDFSDSGGPTTGTFSNGTTVPVSLSTISLYSDPQKKALRIIALTFASLSITAGTLMFYWYIGLRKRTFRHTYINRWFLAYFRLVMALICSDMGRSILEFAYPIITMSRGDVSVDSLYCQIGGFFTALFFEASDLMVFIIAIHTAIYVFNPNLTGSGDESGLWRWRYYVFGVWLFLPALLAGLAFINTTPYVPLVTWCYLPARPLVWRYTLAWGPRYFILLTISVLYIALYIYVRRVYRTIDRQQANSLSSTSDLDTQISSQDHQDTTLQKPPRSYLHRKRPSIHPPLFEEAEKESRASTSPSFIAEEDSTTPTSQTSMITHTPPGSEVKLSLPLPASAPRNNSLATTLTDTSVPTFARRDSVLAGLDPTQTFGHRRARVERQMRTLFIFPIVYFVMWIPPFIYHLYEVITYDGNETSLPPGTFVVTVLATIFLPAQGLVNVCVYAIREKPWRHGKRSPCASLVATPAGSRRHTFCDWKGFSHGEKFAEAEAQAQLDQAKVNHNRSSNPLQAAYTRRDLERQERELARSQNVDNNRPVRDWWDAQDDIESNRG